ncbi:MAG: nicotinate phosphoribosyltransferase [Actinomycetota bacterium]|nr:nicotinate phosphoribosyltransferase [Actinomycetota bacterium]
MGHRSPGLLTDLYEFTMAAALVAEGKADLPSVFSLYIRRLPPSRGFLVAAGLEDVLRFVDQLHFSAEDVAALEGLFPFDPGFLEWLAAVRFTGRVRAVPEGRIVFAGEPLVEIEAPFAVAQLLETYLLNQVTFQTTLATKAARCRHAARGRLLVDFGLRRTHGTDAGMKAARCGAIAGFAATSNVAASARYEIPASGTVAHSFVTAFDSELEAFRAFSRHHRADPVLLVDTYDTLAGVDHAIVVARELAAEGRRLAAIRLDSGDLVALARLARERLDAAGLAEVKIFASGGLDEYAIERLLAAGAPVEGFGVGTAFGVSEDAPTLESVYKLVEIDGRPVAKASTGKATLPGAKQVWRRPRFSGDILALNDEPAPAPDAEPVLAAVEPKAAPDAAVALAAARERFEVDWSSLAAGHKALTGPEPYPVVTSAGLESLAHELAKRH